MIVHDNDCDIFPQLGVLKDAKYKMKTSDITSTMGVWCTVIIMPPIPTNTSTLVSYNFPLIQEVLDFLQQDMRTASKSICMEDNGRK